MLRGDVIMAKIEQCPGFETFGADVKAAREKLGVTRKELAEQVDVEPRYLASIELGKTLPSLPVVIRLIHLCNIPTDKYFNPELRREISEQRHRVIYKVQTCSEKYLSVIESTIDELGKLAKLAD